MREGYRGVTGFVTPKNPSILSVDFCPGKTQRNVGKGREIGPTKGTTIVKFHGKESIGIPFPRVSVTGGSGIHPNK
jgi:hypothetical protein